MKCCGAGDVVALVDDGTTGKLQRKGKRRGGEEEVVVVVLEEEGGGAGGRGVSKK